MQIPNTVTPGTRGGGADRRAIHSACWHPNVPPSISASVDSTFRRAAILHPRYSLRNNGIRSPPATISATVIKAILVDTEGGANQPARTGADDGHLLLRATGRQRGQAARNPCCVSTAMRRAFNAIGAGRDMPRRNRQMIGGGGFLRVIFAENPLKPPIPQFNFFLPDYQQPGTFSSINLVFAGIPDHQRIAEP